VFLNLVSEDTQLGGLQYKLNQSFRLLNLTAL
jgi:hypothetical protein